MADWEIIEIREDRASDTERWLIVYRVPADIAPDGVYSASMPKGMFEAHASMFEYDPDDPGDMDDLFDHVMSLPMMRRTTGDPDPVHPYKVEPGEGRARAKELVSELKAGKARLKPAPSVKLDIRGMPKVADSTAENPKYIIKRDMLERLDRDRLRRNRDMFRIARANHTRTSQ